MYICLLSLHLHPTLNFFVIFSHKIHIGLGADRKRKEGRKEGREGGRKEKTEEGK